MELKEIVGSKGKLTSIPINIDQIIGTYKNKYDAVVGNYTLDSPLPMLSTLRTTLLDYVTKLQKLITLTYCLIIQIIFMICLIIVMFI